MSDLDAAGSGIPTKTANALRTLNLTLNLANTERGLTRRQIGKLVEEYRALTPETFQRTFERDLGSLREAGLVIEVSRESPPRYRLCGSSFPAPEVSFSEVKAGLLAGAAGAWRGLGQTDLFLLRNKLASYTDEPAVPEAPLADHNLEGVDHLPQIVTAIEKRWPLRFLYASRRGTEERDVAPWSLLFRGRAVYMTGFDLNRWAPRRFRLSRIQSDLEPVAEPDAYEIPEESRKDFESGFFRVRPLLWIEVGFGALARLKCEAPLSPMEYPPEFAPRPGWELVWGHEDDQSVWEQLILEDCLHVVPAENSALRRRLKEILAAAASWPTGAVEGDGR